MAYTGENGTFTFRDGYCESLPGKDITSSDAALLGRTVGQLFRRFSAGCQDFRHTHILYSLCSGIAECGKDVYLCENTDLPSLRFSCGGLGADCCIFVSGDDCVRISMFGEEGFPVPDRTLKKIMELSPAGKADICGRIMAVTSFSNIYMSNISDSTGAGRKRLPAGVSCGNRAVRELWCHFFTGDDDNFIFQISDNGQRINAYSVEYGFLSYERLTLAYVHKLVSKGETVWLPEDFHYGADTLERIGQNIRRFSPENSIPKEAVRQRFLTDPLFMCVDLLSHSSDMNTALREIPVLAAVRRDIPVDDIDNIPCGRTIFDDSGRVIIRRSGRNRISLTAQAFSQETAAELCSFWTGRLTGHEAPLSDR